MSSADVQVPRKSLPDNRLTFHRWLVGMQCRKDILNQNQVINKRIVKKVTPISTRLKSLIINNKMRTIYFVGFCFFFSLDKLYDWAILDNIHIQNIHKRASLLMSQKSGIRQEQKEIRRMIAQSKLEEVKLKQLTNLFMELDKKIILNKVFMNKVGRKKREYEIDYVNLGNFVDFFKQDELNDIISRLKEELPSFSLQI